MCRFESIWSAAVLAAVAATTATAQEDVLVPGGPLKYSVRPLPPHATPPAGEFGASQPFHFIAEQKQAETETEGELWLGVQIAVAPEMVKRQLKLEHGLAVEEVAPESPAAKAEIKRFDILVKADGSTLKEPGDLMKSVESSQGKEMTLTLVREGQDQSIKVTATKRPESKRMDVRVLRPELSEEIQRLEEALARIKAKAGDKGVELLFAKPALVPSRADLNRSFSWKIGDAKQAEFPTDLSIELRKSGRDPARIHVKRGDQEWDISEKEVDKIPDDIRPHVMRYLGHGPVLFRSPIAIEDRVIRVGPEGQVEGEVHLPPLPPRPPVPARPAPPPVPPLPPVKAKIAVEPRAATAARREPVERPEIGEQQSEKLDAILRKLDSVERLQSEVKGLRKELDEVRAKKN